MCGLWRRGIHFLLPPPTLSFLQDGGWLPNTVFWLLEPQAFLKLDSRDRGREAEREGEKHQHARETAIGCLLQMPQQRIKSVNPGICSDQESNWQPFSLQDDVQPIGPHWRGLQTFDYEKIFWVNGRPPSVSTLHRPWQGTGLPRPRAFALTIPSARDALPPALLTANFLLFVHHRVCPSQKHPMTLLSLSPHFGYGFCYYGRTPICLACPSQ